MKVGFIGLGRMGMALVQNLIDNGHEVVAYNRSADKVQEAVSFGASAADSLEDMIEQLEGRRTIWLMVTASAVDEILDNLEPLLRKGDIIIEGGNSYFEESQRRAKRFEKKGVAFLDCGTSGGVEGARHGACMMIGGPKEAFSFVETIFRDSCVEQGYAHVGSSGAGHFVKMVHNGIEYGMMGALGEGMHAISNYQKKLGLDLKGVSRVYAHGSIVEGKLSSLLERGLKRADFDSIAGTVPKGETEEEMERLEKLADMPILTEARMMRVRTRTKPTFAGKIIATLRNEFGGHKLNTNST